MECKKTMHSLAFDLVVFSMLETTDGFFVLKTIANDAHFTVQSFGYCDISQVRKCMAT